MMATLTWHLLGMYADDMYVIWFLSCVVSIIYLCFRLFKNGMVVISKIFLCWTKLWCNDLFQILSCLLFLQ